MKTIKYLGLGVLAFSLTACGEKKAAESNNAEENKFEAPVPSKEEAKPSFAQSNDFDSTAVALDSCAAMECDAAASSASFNDDIDFEWNGQISHDIYDDYTYEQLMNDPEIDNTIASAKKKYYNEKKVEAIVKKIRDDGTFTMDDYKEVIQELRAISIYEILWARTQLEVEHMKSTGEMAEDDYSTPKTACQKAYRNISKKANHGLLDVDTNVSSMLGLLRFADLDLEAKEAFYEAKKLRAYYGKVIDESNRVRNERKGY